MAKVLALDVKMVGLRAGGPEGLCPNPCRSRLLVLDAEWRPSAPWGIARYKTLLAVEPVLGAAGGTPLVCPWGGSHCYKVESVGLHGFWGRGAETLAAHAELCGAMLACTVDGPWVEALRAMMPRVSIVVGEAPGAYCADPLHNPFFHEGGATLAYELYEQVGVPDAIVAPGYPALLESLRVGYERLAELGLLEEPPRIYAVDVGVGVPRWLASSLELYEVSVGRRHVEEASRGLREARLPATPLSALAEAARLELLSSGELGRDERVVTILL